jgi:hypothetical protein
MWGDFCITIKGCRSPVHRIPYSFVVSGLQRKGAWSEVAVKEVSLVHLVRVSMPRLWLNSVCCRERETVPSIIGVSSVYTMAEVGRLECRLRINTKG